MPRSREEMLAEKQRLKAEYKSLYQDVAALLFRHDPIHINFGDNADEYEPEVGTILPRLRTCQSAADIRQVVHEEFVRWFGPESAGAEDCYQDIATEIWELWRKFKVN